MPIDKEASRRWRARLREVFMAEWDPIGVGGLPGADDEYNGYVIPILALLEQGKAGSDLFNYMWWVEREHMGLDGDAERTKAKAHQLYALFHGIPN